MLQFKDYQQALLWVFEQRPHPFHFPGNMGHKRMKAFLKTISNPQDSFKSIHIAGTSGKGSTATMLSKVLSNHDFKTGLVVSPHLLDPRERIQINGALISETTFLELINELSPKIIAFNKTSHLGELTTFEILLTLAFKFFAREAVNYAVIETGIGGLLDATNSIHRQDKLAVITQIGYDHQHILGNSLKEIAKQKAGIVQNCGILITHKQSRTIDHAIKEIANTRHAKIIYCKKAQLNYSNLPSYQKTNADLVFETLKTLSSKDHWILDSNKTQQVLANFSYQGRFDLVKTKYGDFLLDGAHNEQKMQAFISSLIKKYPGEKFDFIIGFKHGKNYQGMLKLLTPYANSINLVPVFLEFPNIVHIGVPTKELTEALDKLKFHNYEVNADAFDSLKAVLQKPSPRLRIISGSLYLVASAYKKLS